MTNRANVSVLFFGHLLAGLLFLRLPSLCTAAAAGDFAPSVERIEQWEKMLPDAPRSVGPTIEDRKAWRTIAALPGLKGVVDQAEQLRSQPAAEFTDELYLDFFRTGNRHRGERILAEHLNRLCRLVLAECVENQGRFLPDIEAAIRAICSEKTWVLPAHDRGQINFREKGVTLDLRSTAVSWNLAIAQAWLGDRLSPGVRTLIREQLEWRTFAPFTKTVREEGTKGLWRTPWLTRTNNWNSVCLAGVAGAALAAIDSRRERAFFAAAAEKNIKYFLRGFTPDGYCSEGVGYWNYGFGRYVMLAETLRSASGGHVDLLAPAAVRTIARFPRRMEMMSGVYPAFADCGPDAQPDPRILALLDRRYGGASQNVAGTRLGYDTHLFALALLDFPCAAADASNAAAAKKPMPSAPLRDWFPDAGVLISRPAAESQHALGAAMKGGHNAEQHNHNDVGSFVVALGRSTPLVDPGNEIYTARTFSPRRYDSNVLNSFGHDVPRVAGRLQAEGRQFAARVLRAEFTEKTDTLAIDLAPAYPVQTLKRLERTFVFSREGHGSLVVADEVEFASPQAFGTALMTFGPWKQTAANRLQIGDSANTVDVEIDADGGEFRIVPETIREQLPQGRTPTRLGIELTKSAVAARIRIRITPR